MKITIEIDTEPCGSSRVTVDGVLQGFVQVVKAEFGVGVDGHVTLEGLIEKDGKIVLDGDAPKKESRVFPVKWNFDGSESDEPARPDVKLPCDPNRRFLFTFAPQGDAPDPGSPYLKTPPPGTWYWSANEKTGIPYIVCPECRHGSRLGNHTVSEDGTVNPSLVCPMAQCGDGVARCSAHYYGKLLGWKENKFLASKSEPQNPGAEAPTKPQEK